MEPNQVQKALDSVCDSLEASGLDLGQTFSNFWPIISEALTGTPDYCHVLAPEITNEHMLLTAGTVKALMTDPEAYQAFVGVMENYQAKATA